MPASEPDSPDGSPEDEHKYGDGGNDDDDDAPEHPSDHGDAAAAGEETRDRARNFTGSLLVAHPSLKDPNFRRSVLFLSAHDRENGALGLTLNRPLPGKSAADLLPEHAAAQVLAGVPVYLGGPVGRDQLSFAEVGLDPHPEGALRFRHHLSLPEAIALVEDVPGRLWAFVGYAGWGGGQLEAEMEQSAWMLVEPRARFFRPPAAAPREDRSWFRIMASLGPVYQLLAAVPDDVTLN